VVVIRPRSRRAFLRGAGIAFAGAAPILTASCGGGDEERRRDPAVPADVDVLNEVLNLEFMAMATYRSGLPHLRGPVAAIARELLEQEQEHAERLRQAVEQLGGRPNRPKRSYELPTFTGQGSVLRFTEQLERIAIEAYIDALTKLSEPELRGTAAAIATNEAEHEAVLLGALGQDQAPRALVTGGR
jgi:rubrerythrin